MICTGCRLKNDHAVANQPNGTYVCFDCRGPAPVVAKAVDVSQPAKRHKVFGKMQTGDQLSMALDGWAYGRLEVLATAQMPCTITSDSLREVAEALLRLADAP